MSVPERPSEAGSVTLMIQRLRSDDPNQRDLAARLVWERYFQQLLALARRQLAAGVRARVDEEDILQSVYESVCRRQGRGEFDLVDRDDLWRLLVTVTLRKAKNAGRQLTRAKRDMRREHRISANSDGDERRELDLPVLEPSPLEAMALAEAFQARLDALPNESLRAVAVWKLEGYSNREIAVKLECAERSVERKLSLIRQCWEREAADEA